MEQIDYKKINLKVGLELHQQLDANNKKLFCECDAELSDNVVYKFVRRLRPSQSELGEIDPAALFEFIRGREFVYLGDTKNSCLVEMDEEPPHRPNQKAIDISLAIALMLKATPVDEIHVTRKIVIDGSTPFGFQRTAVVAMGGEVVVDGKIVPIQTVCLEEDACRPDRVEGLSVYYRLDRLGVPLVEVATGPVIGSPEEAVKVALAIGRLMRATKGVKRGIGSIRQDLNVSIMGGNVVEIKGIQELALLYNVLEYEVQRQFNLIKIRDELVKRGAIKENIVENFMDVSNVFKDTKCNIIKRVLQSGGVVMALKLLGFAGLLRYELEPGIRFGTELADYAKFWGGVGGLFHTDELPNYGISGTEVAELKKAVEADDSDCVVIVADDELKVVDALKAVVNRVRKAFDGVPEETRGPYPDGTTHYSRPKPGAARMYPETDISPVTITKEHIDAIRSMIPELPEATLARLVKQYNINSKLAIQLIDSDYVELFESIVERSGASPTFVAVSLTETLKYLKRDNVNVDKVSVTKLTEIFNLIGSNFVAKESFPDIVKWLAENESCDPKSAVEHLGLRMLSPSELDRIIDNIMKDNEPLIKKRGVSALGTLIGIVMSNVRGRVDARVVSQRVKEKLEEAIS